jgi:CMP-N,N'-diacetyllegionaminic acid synthase
MKVLGIIPARKGSKRVPDKNFRPFNGKPLFTYMVDAALQSTVLTDILVSTDHDEILKYCKERYPQIIALPRPPQLSADQSPAIEYVEHALKFLKHLNKEYDAVVILQPSSPLTLPADIDSTVSLLFTSGADTAVSVVKLDHMVHPFKLKTLEQDKLIPFLKDEAGKMAAHELPEVYVRNCAVYATRIHCIRQGKIIGDDCRGYVMPPERSVDINEMIDFEFAEFLKKKEKFDNG